MDKEPIGTECPICRANHTIESLKCETKTVECGFEVCTRCGSTFVVMWDDPDVVTGWISWLPE
jgi:hypothetical protein